MERPIGIFDSGVGGISVLREAVRVLPEEKFLFVGDNKNAPYGSKTREEIITCVDSVVEQLLEQNIKALVIACNTATAAAAKELRARLPIPVIGMEPALKPAHLIRKEGQIIVLATPATLRMEKFADLMEKYGEGAVPVPGCGIVECVESGHIDDAEIEGVLHGLLDAPLRNKTDAIVLGCTHYVFVKNALARVAPHVPLVDGNMGTVQQLNRVLKERGIRRAEGKGSYALDTTGDRKVYIPLMERLMNL